MVGKDNGLTWKIYPAQAREKLHLSQEEVAQRLNVTVNTVYRWEAGRSVPYHMHVRGICELYGVEAGEVGLEAIDASLEVIEIKEDFSAFMQGDLTMRLLELPYKTHRSYQDLHDTMTDILSDTSYANRREALRRLAILSAMALGACATHSKPSQLQNLFNQCAAGIAACRELGKGKDAEDIALAFKGATTYLAALLPLVQTHKTAANLAAQAARIKATLAWHVENLQQAAIYARDAANYAKMADDPSLLISILISQSWICYYDRQTKESLAVIRSTIPILKSMPDWRSSLITVRVLSTLAIMEAKNGKDEYSQALVNAHKAIHSPSLSDHFSYSDSANAEIIGNEGMAYYHAGKYESAFDSFSQLIDPEQLSPIIPLSGKARVEMLHFMTLSSLKRQKKDMDKTIVYWKAGLQGAQGLQSRQRLAESGHIYDTMEAVWPGEQRIKDLRELTVHW